MVNDPARVKTGEFLKKLVDPSNPGIGTSPIYSVVLLQIETIFGVWMVLPGKGNPVASNDPQQTLADLSAFKNISLKDIQEASAAVTGAFQNYFRMILESFFEIVGEDTITTKELVKIFETRRSEEITQQNSLIAAWTERQKKLTDCANKLSIPLSSAPVEAKKEKKPKEKVNFAKRLWYVEDKTKSKETQPVAENSWQTEPVVEEDFKDLKLVERIWDFLFKQNVEPAALKQSLAATYGMDEPSLVSLFSRVFEMANLQIDQSQKILVNIQKDYEQYQGCLNTALQLQAMLVEIGEFFGFTVGKETGTKPPKR